MQGETISLTNGQQEGLTKMLEWVKIDMKASKDDYTFSFSGSAGTGKTTVMDSFIKQCGIRQHKIAVSAPTHKAKSEISRRTGIEGHTLQGLLGLRPDTELDNFDVNNPAFSAIAEPKISLYDLVIIDECSMVNADLEETLNRQAKIYDTKIVYVGDRKQLPPINEAISTTFTKSKHSYTLTEIVRQNSTNPLMEIIEALCNDIDNNTNTYLKYFTKESEQFNDLGEGYLLTRHIPTFNEYLGKAFLTNNFANNTSYVKFLAWTNQNVKGYNDFIKRTLNTNNNMLNVGELLMSYKTYSTPDGFPIVCNSEEYTIKNITPIFSSVINCNTFKLDLYDSNFNEIKGIVMVDNKNLEEYTKVFENKLNYAKEHRGRAWKVYYEFKQSYLLLQDLMDDDGHRKYLLCKKDFDYGYGVTVHKSQGSTYNNVFINARDILLNKNVAERRKLLYVALSRTKEKAFILI